jgi:hypothetical protein
MGHNQSETRRTRASALAAILALGLALPVALPAQERPAAPPGGTRPGMSAMDPVGFLLENRDSLRLADSVVMQLVRVNMRLFRQNRQLQMRIDSLLPAGMAGMAGMGGPAGMGGTTEPQRGGSSPEGQALPDSVLALIRPLAARMRENARIAQEAAMALLSDSQQVRARDLETARLQRQGGQDQRRRRP